MNSFQASHLNAVHLVRPENEVVIRFDETSIADAHFTIRSMREGDEPLLSCGESVALARELTDFTKLTVRRENPSQQIPVTISERLLPLGGREAHDFFIHGPELELRLCCCTRNASAVVDKLTDISWRGDFVGTIGASLRQAATPVSRYISSSGDASHVPTGAELVCLGGDFHFAQRAFLIIFDYDRIDDALEAVRSYVFNPAVPRALTKEQAQALTSQLKETTLPPGWY